jgi:hypothetical protein
MFKEYLTVVTATLTALGTVVGSLVTGNQIGPEALIIVGACVAMLLAVLGYIILNRVTKPITTSTVNLSQHPFFFDMLMYINTEIPSLKLKSKPKEDLAKKFLEIKFRVFREGLLERIKDPCFKVEDHKTLIYELIKKYESEAIVSHIPVSFVNKFRDVHQPITNMAVTTINSICDSNYIFNDEQKHASILYIYSSAFKLAMQSAKDALNMMNGELKKEICNHCAEKGEDKQCTDGCIQEGNVVTHNSGTINKLVAILNDEVDMDSFRKELTTLIVDKKVLYKRKNTSDYFVYMFSTTVDMISDIYNLNLTKNEQSFEYVKSILYQKINIIRQAGTPLMSKNFMMEWSKSRSSYLQSFEKDLLHYCITADTTATDYKRMFFQFFVDSVECFYLTAVRTDMTLEG